MKKKLVIGLISLISSISQVFATHNRAGEITYRHISGFTYEITVTTYTNIGPSGIQADRCELTVYFGDGDSAVFSRSNGSSMLCHAPQTDGVPIGNDTKVNIYKGTHTYPGAASYWISMEDMNRNGGILNIPNSLYTAFYIRSLLVINSVLGDNKSVVLLNPPIDRACINKCFMHNPVAYDADGDSISYELVSCLAQGGTPVYEYTLPNIVGGGNVSLDAYTGDFVWCAPQITGEYNIAILVKEWRRIGSKVFKVGEVMRDMQITVTPCNNNPPVINDIKDTCVDAGTLLKFPATAIDPDSDIVTLSVIGGPASPFITSPAALFTSVTAKENVSSEFSWQTACSHIRKEPYYISFKATDNDFSAPLVDYETVSITIVAPAPKDLNVIPSGTSMVLNWSPSPCSQAVGYKIYRKNNFSGWKHGACETGVPSYTGYALIAKIDGLNTTKYVDNNNSNGLVHGIDYCYMIIAYYPDGAESYASEEFCSQLIKDVPIITNVSITNTDVSNGSILIKWIKPIADATNLDTIANPGPYEFSLLQATGFDGTFSEIKRFTSPYFANLNDTAYTSNSLNTATNPYSYKIEFYCNGGLKGSTRKASSIYLTITPSDNQHTLNWQQIVPWTNFNYVIHKQNSQSLFVPTDTTSATTYIDAGLINGQSYCYFIESLGEYSDTTIVTPLINYSQQQCATPLDLIPPCSPVLAVNPDCILSQNSLSWTNPNHFCSDDAILYNLYYTPIEGEDLQLLTTITNIADTVFLHNNLMSIAGCYAVTAVDSFVNESKFSSIICVDNCPVYDLPNVFTPNGDGRNDFYTPVSYKYVKDVDMKIYNRWGQVMFETTETAFKWDGKSKDTKQFCADGTYFYVCIVNEIHVKGIEPKTLKGFIQLFHDDKPAINK